jgi:Pyridoxamine 5'-phosphate oxidase
MTDVLQQDEVARRLTGEPIGWLTTVNPDGQPQSSPVWFVWDGESLSLRSQPHAGKVRNVGANPGVAFHLARLPGEVRPGDPRGAADDAGTARGRLLDHDPDHADARPGLVRRQPATRRKTTSKSVV